jgi:hypothetical protein
LVSLEELISQLRGQKERLASSNEEAAKQGIVLPVLSALGWDIRNTLGEVCPEYRVGGKRVDYCLMIGTKPKVFVEAKDPSKSLENHEEQLLGYAYNEGIELAALTTGLVWWLYLPMRASKKADRKFAIIRIINDPDAAKLLKSFLGRGAVADGSALRASQEAIIKENLGRAWENLCAERHDVLIEGLAEKVRDLSGYEPEPKTLERFFKVLATRSYLPELIEGDIERPVPESDVPLGKSARTASKYLDSPYGTNSKLRNIFEDLRQGLLKGEIERRASSAGLDPKFTRWRLINDGKGFRGWKWELHEESGKEYVKITMSPSPEHD